jgi:protein-disulfide isomerase
MGEEKAAVVIVEFTDYQCPFCAQHAATVLPELKRGYVDSGKVSYVVRDLPLPSHKNAIFAAVAARCANENGQYWRMHDKLFEQRENLVRAENPEEAIILMAKEAGISQETFSACMRRDYHERNVLSDLAEARKVGFSATPTFVIGTRGADGAVTGKVVRGAKPLGFFEAVIDSVLRAGDLTQRGH